MITDFMGKDGFIWFAGVVEDRADPLKLGRVRVRCLGYHTEDREQLPTTDLPWAHPLLPITSSGVSGIGQTPLGLVEGSWVIGFFRDADTKQDAVILGALPGKPTTSGAVNAAEGLGFSDPNGVYPRAQTEGSTAAQHDVNRLARNDADDSSITLEARKALRENTYAAEYPYNHVYETESGHLLEFDDTPNQERILQYHHSGTETEITAAGTKNEINKDSTYTITEKNNKVYIKGDSDITLGGRHKVIINADGQTGNNYDIQIGPNANVNIQVEGGNVNVSAFTSQNGPNTVGGDINLFAGKDITMAATGQLTISANKIIESSQTTTTRSAQGEYHTYGSPIDHN